MLVSCKASPSASAPASRSGPRAAEHPYRQQPDGAGNAAAVALEHGHGRGAHRLARHPSPCRRSSRRTRRGAARSARSAPTSARLVGRLGRPANSASTSARHSRQRRRACRPQGRRRRRCRRPRGKTRRSRTSPRACRRAAGACPSRTRCPKSATTARTCSCEAATSSVAGDAADRGLTAHRAARPDAGAGAARPAPCRRGPSAMPSPLSAAEQELRPVELDPLRQRVAPTQQVRKPPRDRDDHAGFGRKPPARQHARQIARRLEQPVDAIERLDPAPGAWRATRRGLSSSATPMPAAAKLSSGR